MMSQYTLTLVDTTGIQNYIFGSNKLKHSIGASHLVHEATHDWVYEQLNQLGQTNINTTGDFDNRTITNDRLVSELVYVGGGNAVILFDTRDNAKTFTQQLTRHALVNAPGLELVVAQVDFNWQEDALKEKVTEAFEKLGQKKRNRSRSRPLLGLGVTADCQYTGLPAVQLEQERDEPPRRVSAETAAKFNPDVLKPADQRLKAEAWSGPYEPAYRADSFGREVHESSYLAVVHIDGNGVGKRIQDIAEQYQHPSQNPEYIQAMRDFSRELSKKSEQSLRTIIEKLNAKVVETENGFMIGGAIKLHQDDRGVYLPIRPLVFGGDDLTFICDGRLGLSLAVAYMQDFNQHLFPAKGDQTKSITTRAGVAVVKTHYPFARAYELAEALAKSAKKYLSEPGISDAQKGQLCPLDWHFAVGGTVLDLETIRKREYYNPQEGNLTMRPIRVIGQANDWRSWDNFRKVVTEFQGEEWKFRRNKVKALREALRNGRAEVKAFLHNFNQGEPLPKIVSHISHLSEEGWADKRCAYFDPIEAMDFFIPLDDTEEKTK